MMVEYVPYRVVDERGTALIETYKKAAEYLEELSPCLAYGLSQCLEDKSRYILRIEWKSIEGYLEGFQKGPGFGEFFRLLPAVHGQHCGDAAGRADCSDWRRQC